MRTKTKKEESPAAIYQLQLFGVILPYKDDLLSAFTHNRELSENDFDCMWDNVIEFLRKSGTDRIGILPENYVLSVDLMDGKQTDHGLPPKTIALSSDIEGRGWAITVNQPKARGDQCYGSVEILYNKIAATHFGTLDNETTVLRFLHSIKIPNIFEVLSYREIPAGDIGKIWLPQDYEDD
jgi:hypothetical protein